MSLVRHHHPHHHLGLNYSGVRTVAAPVVATSAVRAAPLYSGVAPAQQLAPVLGETRVEYHPYNKTVIDYE